MNESTIQEWEEQVAETAAHLAYPPTPEFRRRRQLPHERVRPLRRHALAWASLLFTLLLLITLTLPSVRAAVLEFLQIGGVRLELPQPTATASASPAPGAGVAPAPTGQPWALAGATTLAEAAERVDFPIRLPAYPPDLGAPDQVYLQDRNGALLVLVWLEPGTTDEVRLALFQLGSGVWVTKSDLPVLVETAVNGRRAAYVEGFHILRTESGGDELVRLAGENVLVWTAEEGGQEITYRLESGLSLEEAVRIAESLE